jgi:hypothetical protein
MQAGNGLVDRAAFIVSRILGLDSRIPSCRSRDQTCSACDRSGRPGPPVISTLSDAIFRSALFGILLCRRGKMPQKVGERIWNTFFQDITIVVTEAIADVRQSFPPEFCRLISLQTLHVQNSCARAIPRRMSVFGSNGAISVLVPYSAETHGHVGNYCSRTQRRSICADTWSFARALVPESEPINQKFRNDEGRAVADKVPTMEARSNKSAQAL